MSSHSSSGESEAEQVQAYEKRIRTKRIPNKLKD